MVDYRIRTNQRAAFVGKTTSGKTFLARNLLYGVPRLMVFDPKGKIDADEWELEEYNTDARKDLLSHTEPARVLIRADAGEWEPYLELAWQARNVLVYLDEVYGIVEPGTKPPAILSKLYTRGAGWDIGVWAATQRPTWIPLFILTEAEWFFAFRLTNKMDRKRMAEVAGDELEQRIPASDPHGFWMYYVGWESPRYIARYNPTPRAPAAPVRTQNTQPRFNRRLIARAY